jgi:hypothetical protein
VGTRVALTESSEDGVRNRLWQPPTADFGRGEVDKGRRLGEHSTPRSKLVGQSARFAILDIKSVGNPSPALRAVDGLGTADELVRLGPPRLKYAQQLVRSVGRLDICGRCREPMSGCGELTVERSHRQSQLRCDLPTVSSRGPLNSAVS